VAKEEGKETSSVGEGGTNDTEEPSEWDNFVASVDEADAPQLALFLEAQSKRQNLQQKSSAVFEECLQGMSETLTKGLIHDSVVGMHEQQSRQIKESEARVEDLIKSNIRRKETMVEALKSANECWVSQYSNLCDRVVNSTNTTSNPTTEPKTLSDVSLQGHV